MGRLLLFLCLLATAIPAFATDEIFKFRIREDLGTLDWSYGEVNKDVVFQMMEGLTLSGKNGEPMPGVAESWKWVNPTKIVFKLKEKANWSDGRSICAQDFVDAWTKVMDPKFGSLYAHYLFMVKSVSVKGCKTLEVNLKHPASYFPELTSHWVFLPIRKDLQKKYGKKWFEPQNFVVTGPYTLHSWKRGQHLELARNALYHGQAPSIKRMKAVVIKNDNTALTLFFENQLDWIRDLPFVEKAMLSKKREYKLSPTFVSYHLGFNLFDEKVMIDRHLRCALSLALNKSKIPTFLGGGERPAWGLTPKEFYITPHKPTFNLKRAKKLWNKETKPITVHYYSKNIHKPLMEWIQNQWTKHLGATVHLKQLEEKTYWGLLHKSPPSIFLSGITAAYAHPYSFLSEFLSKSAANWGKFSSADYDAFAMKTAKNDQMKLNVKRAEKILIDDECAIIPLYFRKTASLVSTKWNGFHLNPMTYVYLKDVSRIHTGAKRQ